MAGPGDERAARTGDGGRLRASHADREQVIDILKAAFVQGMLDKDEFDLRASQVFASRTYADLAPVTADIPVGLAAAPPPEPAPAQDGKPVLRPGPVIMAATVVFAGVWGIPFLTDSDNHVIGFLLMMTTLAYVWVLLVAGGHMLALRHDKRSRRQLPPRSGPAGGDQASQSRPSTGPAGQFPSAPRGQQHTAEAARSRPFRRSRPGSRSLRPSRPGGLPAARRRMTPAT